MIQNTLNLLLIINHIVLLVLVLSQNEITKKTTISSSFSSENFSETITWICLFFEFLFLILKLKIN
jgi:phosphate starvation-inducible membrane PsiE